MKLTMLLLRSQSKASIRKTSHPPSPISGRDDSSIIGRKPGLMNGSKVHHTPKWQITFKLALEKDVLPVYGSRLVSDIRRRDAIAILVSKAADAPGQARNLHKALRGMFGYALEREMIWINHQ